MILQHFFITIYNKVRQNARKKIILPEYSHPKILQSTATLVEKDIVTPVFIGDDADTIAREFDNNGVSMKGVQILQSSEYRDDLS